MCIEIAFFSEETDEGTLSSDGIGVEGIVNLSSLVVLSDEDGASRGLLVLAPLPVPLGFDGVFIRPPPPLPRCRACPLRFFFFLSGDAETRFGLLRGARVLNITNNKKTRAARVNSAATVVITP